MRRTILIALAVLALSLGLCGAGAASVRRAVDEAEALRLDVERAVALGDIDGARTRMRDLYDRWESRGRTLEFITSHDALYEARGRIIDALLCLEQGQKAEFRRASAAVAVALESLRVTEALRWENLY